MRTRIRKVGRCSTPGWTARNTAVRGALAHCESLEQVKDFPWPTAEYLNIESCLRDLRDAGDVYRLSGYWTCFYHNVADLFGMEEYFVKMHTAPDVVHAVTNKVCEFYYEANERFFAAAGSEMDGFFFGNDLGCQKGPRCNPAMLDEFVFPSGAPLSSRGTGTAIRSWCTPADLFTN